MVEEDLPLHIERIKIEGHEAFKQMRRYYESESFKNLDLLFGRIEFTKPLYRLFQILF